MAKKKTDVDSIEKLLGDKIAEALGETKKGLTKLGEMAPKRRYKEEQAAADADPDVAAMGEQGGMEEFDFRKMNAEGFAAARGQEYADEVKGQMEFDEDLPGDFKDMGRTEAMKKMASEKLGGAVPEFSDRPSEPIGNVSTEMGSSDKDPYRISSEDPEVPGANFSEGLKPTGAFLSAEPVEDAKAPTKPLGNVSTDLLSGEDIARRSEVPADKLAELFKKTHGGSFDPKSKTDKAKMATITSMIGENRDLLNLSPTQFALKVYARKQ